MTELMHRLRRAAILSDGGQFTDGQLLDAYISQRDEAALAALVQRHAPMVWSVCRRVLGNDHDAEDAFQATFLVLVRKAASVKPRSMVANWLYGVAHQTALKARATALTRQRRERQVETLPEPVVEDAPWDELRPVLDEELSRLPNNYRAVIILCDWEGLTRKEAAQQLGVPEGTVAGWVARARGLLSQRLTQRGITLSSGALAALLTQTIASANVPTLLVSNTIKVACLSAAGQATATGIVSISTAALTKGMLQTMFVAKLKLVAATVLVGGVIAGSIGLSTTPTVEAGPPAKVKPGVGPGQGDGSGDGATPMKDKPKTPAKVKPGVGPGMGDGTGDGATPIKKPTAPAKVKPGIGPGMGHGIGDGATPLE